MLQVSSARENKWGENPDPLSHDKSFPWKMSYSPKKKTSDSLLWAGQIFQAEEKVEEKAELTPPVWYKIEKANKPETTEFQAQIRSKQTFFIKGETAHISQM